VVNNLSRISVASACRRLLDQLLVAALDRALALAEVDDVAVGVAEQLHLNVARRRQVFLEVYRGIAERGFRFGARDEQRVGQLLAVAGNAHAAPATARCRLDDDRISDLVRDPDRVRLVGDGSVRSRDHRHTRLLHHVLGDGLVAHLLDGVLRRADPGNAARRHGLRELGVLGEESVAGMNRLRARDLGRGDDAIEVEVAFAGRIGADAHRFVGEAHVQRIGVRLAVHGHGLDAHLVARAHDAKGDLAPVCDENFCEHGGKRTTGPRAALI
jgi:hypothetical protein